MQAPITAAEPIRQSPAEALAARVRPAALAVPTLAFVAGAVAGLHDLQWALPAAAVVFGWSQLTGA
jgi:hypothetical protein